MKSIFRYFISSFICFCMFAAYPSFSWSRCSEEKVILDYKYLGECGHTDVSYFTLNKDAYITKIRVWFDTSTAGGIDKDSIFLFLSGPDVYSDSALISSNGECQGYWCEGIWNINQHLKAGDYELFDETISMCANPSGQTTLKLYGCEAEIEQPDDTNNNVEGIAPPNGISVIDATANPSSAPVYMGNITSSGGNAGTLSGKMELSVDFPAYNKPVDIWILIGLPDGRFYVTDEAGKLLNLDTGGFLTIASGISGKKIEKTILNPFEVGTNGTSFHPFPKDGEWTVYWLVAPDSSGDIIKALENEKYELGFYIFEVKSNSIEGDDFTPKPPVIGETLSETSGPITLNNTTTSISLKDNTQIEFQGLGDGSGLTLTLERTSNTISLNETQLQTSGSMRTITIEDVVYNGADNANSFAPIITIPKEEIGSINPHTVNIARYSTNPDTGETEIHYFPLYTDSSGNLTFRDWIMPVDIMDEHFTDGSLNRGKINSSNPKKTAKAQRVSGPKKIIYAAVTIQSTDNHAVSAKLVRMLPDNTLEQNRNYFYIRTGDGSVTYVNPLSQEQKTLESQKPVQNVVIFVHGHNEAEKTGYEKTDTIAPWSYEYKRDVWNQMYKTFLDSHADKQGCTLFYEFIYPSWRPIFQHLNSALANLMKAEFEPQIKNGMKFNLFIIAHSMGGLVSRAGIQLFEAELKDNLQRFVSWGSPHHGTPLNSFRFAITSPALKNLLPYTITKQLSTKLEKSVMPTQGVFDMRWTMASLGYLESLKLTDFFEYVGESTGETYSLWNLSSGDMLYNNDINAMNYSDDLGEKYTFLYGVTDQVLKENIADWSTAEWGGAFTNLNEIGIGATFVYNLMGNASSQVMGADLGDSDGASPVISMAGVGITDNNKYIGRIDHEQYYHEPSLARQTAEETYSAMQFTSNRCNCPELKISTPSNGSKLTLTQVVDIQGVLIWPEDKEIDKRVKFMTVNETRMDVLKTNVNPLKIDNNGNFTGSFKISELGLEEGERKITFSAVLKDNTKVSVDINVVMEKENEDNNSLYDYDCGWDVDYSQLKKNEYVGSVFYYNSANQLHGRYLSWYDLLLTKPQFAKCYFEDKMHGKSTYWLQNGNKSSEINYAMGILDGKSIKWWENGNKKLEETYKNGIPIGLHTEWYDNGNYKLQYNINENKRYDGTYTMWYENTAQKSFEWHYNNGKEEGLQTYWYENGNKKSEGTVKPPDTGYTPIKTGTWYWWNEDGSCEKIMDFDNDELIDCP